MVPLIQSSQDSCSSCSSSNHRHVRFNDDPVATVLEIDGSEDDKMHRWYSSRDLMEIRKESSTSCSECGDSSKKASSCTCSSSYRATQRAFVSSLLAQQREHKQMGIQDPKGLFQLSRRCSRTSRERARQNAELHAEEAKQFTRETKQVISDVLGILDDMGLDD